MIMIYTGALPGQGPQADINNGLGVTRIVPTFWPQHLFKLNLNNGPSPGHSNFGQTEDIHVQVSYLLIPGGCHICPRAAGLTSIMAKEVTRIVAPY